MQSNHIYISPAESAAINYLRMLAFVLILGDHFFVFLEVPHISSILVVGVQFFFIISGFLYGKRLINDWKTFFIKRIKKVYIPFVVFLMSMFLIYWVMDPEVLNTKKILFYLFNLQGFEFLSRRLGDSIPYLSHLWFITILFCCLLVTPLLQWARKYGIWSILIVSLLFTINCWHLHQTPLYIFLYSLSYLLASSSDMIKRNFVLFSLVCCIICVPLLTWHDMDLFTWPSMLIKSASAIVIFFAVQSVFSYFEIIKTDRVSCQVSKYSYEGYLVHPTMLMGPIALCSTNYGVLTNVIIFMMSVSVMAVLLNIVCNKLIKI